MMRVIMGRLLGAVPLVILVTAFVFVLVDLAPGDPAFRLAGENPTPEQVEAVRQELNLDDPLPARYTLWISDLLRGDLGESLSTHEKVTDAIGDRISVTFSLALVALALSIVGGAVLGIVAALRSSSLVDRVITVFSAVLMAVPQFWLGMLLVVFFAIDRSWLPAVGYAPLSEGIGTWFQHIILPAFTLSTVALAELALQLRSAMVEEMGRDYVLLAQAKGLRHRSVVAKHALKNSAIPVVTVLGYRSAQVLGGTVVIETVFGLPGLGRLAITSVLAQDIPVVLGLVVLTVVAVLIINLLVDISYGYFNPKVRT